ncbi:MAG: hypothetical protein GQ574_10330 [Crocinitomix sp.]|nr:hypothetical protein [Crocinitomix sp.]
MKNLKRLLFSCILMAITFSGFSQTALEYMEKISAETKKIQTDMWDYTNAVSHGKSARKVEKRRAELIQTSQQALNRVKNMNAFDGSTSYRDSVVAFLNINYYVLKEDYAKIVDMEEIAEKSYDNMEAYLMAQEGANTKMRESGKMVGDQQAVFAAKNDITLITNEDDELGQKMEIASAVYAHYNKVYLIFFKSYIQESYLMAAINNKDVSGIEQNKDALANTANEGLDLLMDIDAFKNDNSVVNACRNMLKFYKDEAEIKITAITDYFLKTENFNSVNESFSQIKEKNRTQEDVDKFNTAVGEMNAAVDAYNKANDAMNENRSSNLDAWNKAVSKFTDKHVPKGKAK